MENLEIAKIIGLLLLIPIVIAVPLIVVGLVFNTWLEFSFKRRIQILVAIGLAGSVLWGLYQYKGPDFYYNLLSSKEIVLLMLLVHTVSFMVRGYRKINWENLSPPERRSEFANLPLKAPWHTKYHWGTMLQIGLFLLLAFIGK